MNVVFDVNIVLDLLLQRKEYYQEQERCFQLLITNCVPLYFPVCALPTLQYVHLVELKRLQKAGVIKVDENIRQLSKEQLKVFFDQVIICTSLGAHWDAIPPDHLDHEDALISLSASLLPGNTIIWTEDRVFKPLGDIPAVGDHNVVQEALSNKEDSIPFIDLAAQQQRIRTKLDKNIHTVLRHGKYIMGPEVKELEEKLAAFAGVKYCIGCASGTDALLMALMAMDVGPGDAIFTTPFTFIAAAEVISLLGATPVFVDIDPKTFNIDPDKLGLAVKALKDCDPSIYPLPGNLKLKAESSPEEWPSDSTGQAKLKARGVISVDLFGLPCDYDRINAIAKEHDLFVIEDAAQGFGGEYKGKRAGSLADIGCTSFFPAKPLGCYGDGGAVFTNDDAIADILGSIRVHGKGTHKYDNVRIGLNARLDTLQAAILNAKFDIFPQEINLRNQVASKYTELLAPCSTLYAPSVPEGYKSAWAQYSLLSDKKDQIQSALKEKGIPTAVYYPKPLHLQSAFAYLGYKEGDMPASEDCSRRIFSLPMHPYLEAKEIDRICDCIRRIQKR